jgi:hypothetical protein
MVWLVGAALLAVGITTARGSTIYSEGFESLTAGTVNGQASWLVLWGSASDANVVSDGSTAYQGTKFLSLGNAGSGPRVVQTGFEGAPVYVASNYLLSTALRFTETGHNGMQLILEGDLGPDYAVHSYFNALGEIYQVSNYSTFNYLGASISPGQWYNVSYFLTPLNSTYLFTVRRASDDALILSTNLPYAAGGPISNWYDLDLRVDAASGNAWLLDNISFSEIPEPTAMLLASGAATTLIIRSRRRVRRNG